MTLYWVAGVVLSGGRWNVYLREQRYERWTRIVWTTNALEASLCKEAMNHFPIEVETFMDGWGDRIKSVVKAPSLDRSLGSPDERENPGSGDGGDHRPDLPCQKHWWYWVRSHVLRCKRCGELKWAER